MKVDYRVRSVSLLNLYNDISKGLLIPDAYFQRNLVWREIHKKDFIKTILLGFPFPEIFISRGKVDVEKMATISCIVDGQQRTNAITCFIKNEFDVDGVTYNDLSPDKKSEFLKYEIAVIELDINNDDPRIKEIFQRINRTSNSLTFIEKLASEYATSEYMLVAKLISDQIDVESINNSDFKEDPNIPRSFYSWAVKQKVKKSNQLFTSKNIFSALEVSKKTNLIYALNLMSSILEGFYNRNDRVVPLLNDYIDVFSDKDRIVDLFEKTSDFYLKLKFKQKSYWHNKANFFSLFLALSEFIRRDAQINIGALQSELDNFEANVPSDYKLAATEAVNNTSERQLRANYLQELILRCV